MKLRALISTLLVIGLAATQVFAQVAQPNPASPSPPEIQTPPASPPSSAIPMAPASPPPAAYPTPVASPTYPPSYGYPGSSVIAPMPAPGVQQHDGFFLRFLMGAGFTSMTSSESGGGMKLSGNGGAFSLALGGLVSPNLVLFGEIVGSMAANPDAEINGRSLGEAEMDAGMMGMGAGLAYYLPSNVYFSGTFALTQLNIQDKDGKTVGETEFGPGASLLVGKEWWVSDNWGLGVAGHFMFASMKDKGDGPRWSAYGLNLVFSASYN